MIQPNPRLKQVLKLLGLLVIIFMAISIYRYLSMASVTITASSKDDTVTIGQIVGDKVNEKTLKHGLHKLNTHVKPGNYQITAYNHSNTVTKVVSLKARSHYAYRLDIKTPEEVEDVSDLDGINISVDSSRMYFVNTRTSHLMRVTGSNALETIVLPFDIQEIKWMSVGQGVARDKNNNLYLFNDGVVQPLGLPFATNSESQLSYDVNKDGDIYVSSGGSIYIGSSGGQFTKIYQSNEANLGLAASSNKVAVFVMPVSGEGRASQIASTDIIVLARDGKKLASRGNTQIYKAVWSDDGKHLLAKSDYGGTVFNGSLGTAASVPIPDIGDLAWLSNNAFVFANSNYIGEYNLSTRSTQQLSTQADGVISAVYPDVSAGYVYIVSEHADINGEVTGNVIGRVNTKGGTVSTKTTTLSAYLPDSAGACTLGYLNFTTLKYVLYYPPGSDPVSCVGPAQDLLSGYDITASPGEFQGLPLNVAD